MRCDENGVDRVTVSEILRIIEKYSDYFNFDDNKLEREIEQKQRFIELEEEENKRLSEKRLSDAILKSEDIKTDINKNIEML